MLREGDSKCIGCGRAQGEDNRCPACNAIASVRVIGDRVQCSACNKPRDVLPGTHIVSRTPASGRSAATDAAIGWTLGAAATVATGAVMSLGTLLLWGLLPAGAVTVTALTGAWALAARGRAAKGRNARRRQELALLDFVQASGGRVTATDVAKAFRLGSEEADQLLTQQVGDGSRVHVELDADGLVVYVFRELLPPASGEAREAVAPDLRVRVEVEAEGDADRLGEEAVRRKEARANRA